MEENFEDFLREGRLRNIPFGTSEAEIIEKLGPTNSVHKRSRRDRRNAIIKYDRLEFYFDDNQRLNGLMIQLWTGSAPKEHLEFDTEWLTDSLSMKDVTEHLETMNLGFETDDFKGTIGTNNAIIFYFDSALQKVGKFV